MTVRILQGDCREVLKTLPEASVHCVVTSPPYWGLRDYRVAGQIGLERTSAEFVGELVAVFRDVKRVLRDDGTAWVNMGDCYNAYNGGAGPSSSLSSGVQTNERPRLETGFGLRERALKPKDLCLIPERLALALQEDGWWVRSRIIWHKPNPMPESITDRPTKAHEHIWMIAKSERYYYDFEAVKEEAAAESGERYAYAFGGEKAARMTREEASGPGSRTHPIGYREYDGKRNKRDVWTVPVKPFNDAHFATFPTDLIEPCILAGCPEGGTVLDPFGGAGTTGLVADRLKRDAILIELNPEYAAMAERRIRGDAPLFAEVING